MMKILTATDLENLADPDILTSCIADAYRLVSGERLLIPDRMHLHLNATVFLVMPAAGKRNRKEDEFPYRSGMVTKIVSVAPGNMSSGLPAIQGMVLFQDGETGKPLALIDGAGLTAWRTAAVVCTAIRHLAPSGTESLGIIGTGVQGWHIARMAIRMFPVNRLHLFNRSPARAEKFKQMTHEIYPDTGIVVHHSPEALVKDSDVIITATTSETPVTGDIAARGKPRLFIGLGSFRPDVREFTDSLFHLSPAIYCDTERALTESGDLRIPIQRGLIRTEQVGTLSEFLNKTEKSPTSNVFFKSVGLAAFDYTTAQRFYQLSCEHNTGTEIEF